MAKLSRDKGKRGELEFAHFLTDRGYQAHRGQQYHGGPDSPDVICEELPFHIEVKRSERLRIYESLNQSIQDAPPDRIPIVAHRQNGKDWICILPAADLLRLTHSGPLRTEQAGADYHPETGR